MSVGAQVARCTFQREVVTRELFEEIWPLLEAHFLEISHYQDIALNPDVDVYLQAEANGFLRVYTLREGGTLRGYAVFFLRHNIHYRSSLQAVQDVLWLSPALRGRMLGARFLRWCDQALAAEGTQVVYHHIKTAHDFSPLLERLGYEFIEKVYGKRLDRSAP